MATEQPESGTRLTAVEIHDNILEPGEKEIRRPAAALLLSALAAGLVMGFSFLASAFASDLVSPEHRRAAAAAAYPLGFIFVIMARSELFTENTLVPVVPFLEHRDRERFINLARLWGLLLFGNLVGALVFGWALAETPMVEATLRPALDQLATEATSGGFGHVLYAGVFAGWLMALLAWLLASTRSTGAQIALIWLCTFPISALHFRHSIAGSVEAFYLAAGGQATWGGMITDFVVPSVLGNALGGVLLVALLNYGQVAAEKESGRVERRTGGQADSDKEEKADLGAW
ncbi:MAG TPA: formate/nitrite transporter family protein [Gemmatimonadales bacterium]|nr:formate/nitrite transporter family protein [Gemmatimonadales bacterium]